MKNVDFSRESHGLNTKLSVKNDKVWKQKSICSTKKSVKTGFAKDENNNQIPDVWEKKFKFLFTFENIIILVLGIAIGYLLANTTYLN